MSHITPPSTSSVKKVVSMTKGLIIAVFTTLNSSCDCKTTSIGFILISSCSKTSNLKVNTEEKLKLVQRYSNKMSSRKTGSLIRISTYQKIYRTSDSVGFRVHHKAR